jgi:uncharacterized protein (DUF2147 family)
MNRTKLKEVKSGRPHWLANPPFNGEEQKPMRILQVPTFIALLLTSAPGSAQSESPSPSPSDPPSKFAAKPSPSRSPNMLASKAPSHEQNTVAGFWAQTDSQGKVGAWFYFAEVDGLYQGRIVRTFPQPSVAMLGLTLVKGMRREGLNYTDGTILDPRDGDVYKAQMQLSADGQKLSVRGYLAIPLLGQTQVWNRLPDDSIASNEIPPASVSPTSAPALED